MLTKIFNFFKSAASILLEFYKESESEAIQGVAKESSEEVFDPVKPSPADNLRAFMDVIGYAEGTSRLGDNGYNVIVGGSLFHDYSCHPNVLVDLPRLGIKSTAAGRYQILHRYWQHYKNQLKLPDFSPDSQDKYVVQQLRERRALQDVEAGRISVAIEKCKNIWASFPSSPYGQPTKDLKELLKVYVDSGGYLCESDQEKLNA